MQKDAKIPRIFMLFAQREPTMIFGYHRGATLCKKHENPWNFSIFLHFSASAISSGSDKCHLQELSSDLSKKARNPG
jgi:hypothetical protein